MLRMNTAWWLATAAITLLGACEEAEPVDEEDNGSALEDDDVEDEDDDDDDDDDKPVSNRDAGKGKDAGPAKDAGKAPPKDSGGAPVTAALPCDIEKIVSENCGTCHGAEPVSVDFSLTTPADFQANAEDGRPRYKVAAERVKVTGAKRMPPLSQDEVPAADLATLSAWLEGGAKAGTEKCGTTAPKPDAGGISVGEAGKGGSSIEPIEYNDPDLECHKFVAFASPTTKTTPYMVPTTPDYYVAFNMKAPWAGTKYVRSFKSIIDNAKVLHHWLFFKNLVGGSEGIVGNALGAHPDGEMMYGWAPGGDNMYMHDDVGMEMAGDNTTYQIELHYNNKEGRAVPDASGVEVCVTSKKPQNVAQLSWVGTDGIAGTSAVGTCTHGSQQPIRIFYAQPHMHTKGSHMKVVLTRAGGKEEIIHDKPFSFDDQRGYLMDVTLMPGDVLTTECTYNAPATFGKGTNDEMCYFFTQSWPAGALASPTGVVGQLIHGPNTCIDVF